MSDHNDPLRQIAHEAKVLELDTKTVLQVWGSGLQHLNGSLPCPECGAKLAPQNVQDQGADEQGDALLCDAASRGPWRTGSGYEQSGRGNYIADADGLIVCAEQDGTDCVLRTSDRDYIARFDPQRMAHYIHLAEAVGRQVRGELGYHEDVAAAYKQLKGDTA